MHMQRPRPARRGVLGVGRWLGLAGLALGLAACGGAGQPAASTAGPTPPPATPAAAAAPATTTTQAAAANSRITPLSPRATVRLAMSFQVANNLPLMLALQRGDFDRAGLDLQVQEITGSAVAVLPQLSQGQVDIAQTVPAPALFNQAAQGFGARLVAGGDVARSGRIASGYLMVLKDEASQIKTLADLKGKTVEGAAQGSPISLMVESAIRQAGLTSGQDVTVTYRVKGPADFLALIKNHAADVVGTTSTPAVQAEQDGDAVRWKDSNDIIPWYQATLVAASSQFLSANRPAVEKFVEVYVQAERDVNASDGAWTDDLVRLFAQKAGVSEQAVKDQGAVPYFDPNGSVSMDSLTQTQTFWVAQGQVPQAVDVEGLVDRSVAEAAARDLVGGS